MADSSGRELTYGRMLTGGLLVARLGAHAARRRDDRRAAAAQRGGRAGEHRGHAGGPRSGESELHGRAGSHGVGARAVRDPHGRDVARVSGQGEDRDAWRAWSSWKTSWRAWARLARLRALLTARLAPARLLCRHSAAGFARDRHLLERQHRRAQRRDAVALQRAVEYRSDGAAVLDR